MFCLDGENAHLLKLKVPIYLAAGTAAQQLDASFSTNSNLEVYALNLSESGHDMPLVASLPVDQRYHNCNFHLCSSYQ